MKQDRKFPIAVISKKAENSLRDGHVWVYDTEIRDLVGEVTNGCIVDIVTEKGTYMGSGFISEKSKIRLRLLSRNANESFNEQFFARRVKYAIDYRRTVMRDDMSCCRLIFGEADGLPGLTVDRYNNILVTEVLSYGTELHKDEIYRALVTELESEVDGRLAIFERNESQTRLLEGLTQYKGWYKADYLEIPESPITVITENGIKYTVDVENGQKTGFFLDQKYNRLAAARLAKGKRVLDCFTHTGSFAMNAAAGGASHVTAVDISQSAIEMTKANVKLNGFEDRFDFICTDVFELLPKLCAERAEYDYIILDPPAFTKSRKTASDAERGYKEINYRAMKLLPRGGYLATCSCSHFMDNERFKKMLLSAAKDADVSLRLIEERRQGPDHPILMNVPETDYLKFYLFQIV